jgi:hypothetical protein
VIAGGPDLAFSDLKRYQPSILFLKPIKHQTIMSSKDYFPDTDPAVYTFSEVFPTKLDLYKGPLGITAAEIVLLTDKGKDLREFMASNDLARDASKNATAAKDAELLSYSELVRSTVRTIKANPACTPAMLEGMGIAGSDTPFDPSTYQSTLKAEVFIDHVTLKFAKKGVDGVNIYTRLQGTTSWFKLSFDSQSPYIDNRPLTVPGVPEVREYMCMGVLKDVQIGQPSNVVVITFG